MKAKDFLKKVAEQGKINNEDFNKVVETFPEVELGEVFPNLFQESFLTRERAEADPKISQKIKAETLNAVDAKIAKLLPLVDVKDREEIEKEPSSYKKIELLEKAIPNLVTKAKGENPNVDEKVKQLEKNVQEFADKVTTVTREKDEQLKAVQKQHEEEKANLKLDWTLDKKLADYTLADEFIPIKGAIIKNIVDTVKTSNSLQLDEKGQIVVVEIDPATKTAKPKFNGNDPVTIDSLLAEPLKNFLKKNNSKEDKTDKTDKTKRRETQDDFDPSKMTLAQRRQAAAAQ
jgi:hypothetical protein